MIWLKERQRQPEIQDQLDLDPMLLRAALVGLRRINFWSRARCVFWPPIRDLACRTGTGRIRVLDLASGAGDVPIALWQRARRQGLDLEIAGCDMNPRTVEFARQEADRHQAAVDFFVCDVLQEDVPRPFDVAICSLFLHHLDEIQAVTLLRRLADAAGRMVLISDLRRSAYGLALAYLATRLLPTSAVNRVDGPRSVRAAFTLPEARRLAQRADLANASLTTIWPCRFLLTWNKV